MGSTEMLKKLDTSKNAYLNKDRAGEDELPRPHSIATFFEKSGSRSRSDDLHAFNKIQDASKSLEAEYIKSLQQQIYLLELENEYIRQQVNEAKAAQAKVPAALAEITAKLKEEKMQSKGLRLGLTRSEQKIATLTRKQQELFECVRKTEEEKEAIATQLLQTTTEKNELAREKARQMSEIAELRLELCRHQVALSTTETQIQSLRAQTIFDNSRLLLAESSSTQRVHNLTNWQTGQARESSLGVFLFNRNPITSQEERMISRGIRGSSKEFESPGQFLDFHFYRQLEDERQLDDVREQVRTQTKEVTEIKRALLPQVSSQSKTPECTYTPYKSVVSKSVQTTAETQNAEVDVQVSEAVAGSLWSSPHSPPDTRGSENEANEELIKPTFRDKRKY
ncbi:hypothetical protein SprV_0200729600 [Sparganum proliferum]